MLQHEFEDGLKALNAVTQSDLEVAGVIQQGDTGAWVDFTRDRARWLMRLPPARSEKMWSLLGSSMPARTMGAIGDESADALLDLVQLAQDFGWRGDSSLWRWLKGKLEQPVKRGRRGVYMASKVRHAVTWKMLRSTGFPIISTWIDEAGEGETGDFTDLWRRCINEASTAQVVIAYRLPGETLKGAFLEVGAALACGVPVYAVGLPPKGSTGGREDEFTFGAAEGMTQFPNLDAAIEAARILVAVAA